MFSQYWVGNVPGSTITAAQSVVLQGLGNVTATADEINNKFDGSKSYVALVSATYGAAYSILAADTGKTLLVPNSTANVTFSLPAEVAGLNYKIVYIGGAEDAEDWVITSGANANAFIGGLEHQDLDGETIETVYSNGTTNAKLTLDKPGAGTEINLLCNGTKWYIWGRSVSATVPAFAVFA